MNFFSFPKYVFSSLVLLCLFLLEALQAQTPVDVVSSSRITLSVEGNNLSIPYYKNFSLADSNQNVNRAVVVIHGTNRNADDYYDRVLIPAITAGRSDTNTIIIAPQFLVENDVNAHNLSNEVLFWSSGGWKRGDKSRSTGANPRPARISSFAVVDTILYRLAQRNENLHTIVITGHSAGGQFVNRFAAGSQMEHVLNAKFEIHLRFIVANPSSYLYFNNERRVAGTLDQFSVPTGTACQSSYNDYKYGLDELNSYMSAVGAAQIKAQYQQREVIYLLGARDNNPNHSSLDKSCPAALQGSHRLERGKIYYNYIAHYFGSTIQDLHKQAIVPNVGHSSTDMFASNCGMFFMFDWGSCGTITSIESPDLANDVSEFVLFQNYPNPFNPVTTIRFNLHTTAPVYLSIYDIQGKLIKSLASGEVMNKGEHALSWNGTNEFGRTVSSGPYFYQIKTQMQNTTKSMILLK